VSGHGSYTPAYCAPEQLCGGPITRRTDIYSFAVCVLEMYLGERFWANGSVAGASFDDYIDFARIPVSNTMADLLRRCLAEEEQNRPHDFAEVEAALLREYEKETDIAYPRALIVENPHRADLMNNRALSLLDLGKAEEAKAVWMEVLGLDDLALAEKDRGNREPYLAGLKKGLAKNAGYHFDLCLSNFEIFLLKQKAETSDSDYLKNTTKDMQYQYAQTTP
jgi:serine/threonine protein kinase